MKKLANSTPVAAPIPRNYAGPVIDFKRTAKELEKEEPEWIWQEIQREREAHGIPRQPHPLGEDYE